MAQIRVRRGSTSEWSSANPVLASGEPGYDTTTETFKVGNGVDQWDSLDEIKGAVLTVNGQEGTVVLDAEDVGALPDDYSPLSTDEDNAAGLGSDGGIWVGPSQPPGDYVETSELADQFKYAAPVWVLEANEDETDLPGDFPTSPIFSGGPPPIVLRKKDE